MNDFETPPTDTVRVVVAGRSGSGDAAYLLGGIVIKGQHPAPPAHGKFPIVPMVSDKVTVKNPSAESPLQKNS